MIKTIDDAVNELRRCYDIAKNSAYVKNPIAYSLYQTWKKFDRQKEKEQEGE